MSFYNKHGFRVEETARYSEEKQDFIQGFQINYKGVEKPIVSSEGMFDTYKEASSFAKSHKEELEELAKEEEVDA